MNFKNNNITKIAAMAMIAATATLWTGCKGDEKNVEPADPDNEVITTVKITAVNAADTADVRTAQWKDLTPNDGNPDLTQASIRLKKDAVYNVSVEFMDETKSPAENITEEVEERSNYHLVCYQPTSGLNLTVVRTDFDNNTPKLELGVKSKFTTGAASTGSINVSLHHQPSNKNGSTCDLGSTDVDVNYQVTIE